MTTTKLFYRVLVGGAVALVFAVALGIVSPEDAIACFRGNC